jgi:pimeloyl-ACP methyl ester carboxylesterase
MRHLPGWRSLLHLGHGEAFGRREPAVWHYFLQRSGQFPIAAVARRALIVHQLDLRPILPAIHQPVLMICGDRDGVIGKSCEQDLLQGLPHVSRAEIEACGHLPQFTHPEIVCELVERFLS